MFWCDSEIVLAYIGDDSKRYHTFVTNRVSMIRSQTAADQWQHVLLANENWPKKHFRLMVLGALNTLLKKHV